MPEHFNKNKSINKIKVPCKCTAFENIFSCNYSHRQSNSHFLLTDRRRRPRVEEKCKADLSRKDREALESGRAEEVDWDVGGTWCSADTSLVCLKTDGGGTVLLWATGPWNPPWVPFPSPCRWAWNVEVCCSKEKKLSCTLSNCKQGEELWVLLRLLQTTFVCVLCVPAQCWFGAAAPARQTHCCGSRCCSHECDSRLIPVKQSRDCFSFSSKESECKRNLWKRCFDLKWNFTHLPLGNTRWTRTFGLAEWKYYMYCCLWGPFYY